MKATRWFSSLPRRVLLAAALGSTVLSGCSTFSKDGGFAKVQETAKQHLGKDARWIRSDSDASAVRDAVRERLAAPLAEADAVQIALWNNPGLQAVYDDLGIAEADLVQAGRLPNPHLGYLRTRNRGAGSGKDEFALTFPIMELVTMPLRRKVEAARFEQVKLEVSLQTLGVAHETQRAWVSAVTAEQTVKYLEEVKVAAEAAADLARRMARAGNFNVLDQMREQVFYAEVIAQLARARQASLSERERLTRLMGLYGKNLRFKLPERLPDLPGAPPEMTEVEARAMEQRLDIQAARRDTEAVANALGLTKVTRSINVFDLGPAGTREDGGAWNRGFEIALEIPIFDWGSARVARAEAQYMQAVKRVAAQAVNARSEVREAYADYRSTFETAKHYRDEIVPLRARISEQNLLRYNGMLISVFELLADAREQVASVNAYIEALGEFWLAEANMQSAMTGSPSAVPGAMAQRERPAFVPMPVLAGH